ncbi:hypothetical protein [Pedobacter sp. Leaf132]|nr:hypothetical protein [Pedobacter sp. Leaf132]
MTTQIDISADFQSILNPDLDTINFERILELFQKINWKHRIASEIESAFRKSTSTLFIYHN